MEKRRRNAKAKGRRGARRHVRFFASSSLFAFALISGLSALSGAALAADGDEKRAETLFREGREALARGDNAGACAKFTESIRLTRRPGPLLNVAQCDEQRGDIMAAFARWNEGLSLLPAGDERIPVARAHVEALDRRIPRLTIKLPPAIANEAIVRLDGAVLDRAALDQPRQIAPGKHEVVVDLPTRPTWRTEVQVAEGERRELLAAPPAPVEKSSGAQRTAGFVVGAIGVASLVAGGILGGVAIAKKAEVVDNCTNGCNQAARDARDSGKVIAHASTATIAIGAAGLVTGLILALTDRPKPEAGSASVSAAPLPGGFAFSVTGSF